MLQAAGRYAEREINSRLASFNAEGSKRVLLVDCGVKANIIRCLLKRGVEVIRVPWDYDFNGIEFDGLFISNGPGDPDTCDAAVQNIRKAMENEKLPIFGICMGKPAALEGGRGENIQTEIWPSQPQPAGPHGGHGTLLHHFAEPRICGGQQYAWR